MIIPLVIVPAIAFTFLHEYQPSSSEEYKAHKRKYKEIIDKRDNVYEQLLADLMSDKISKEEFNKQYFFNKENSVCKLDNYKLIKTEIKENDAVLGYTSFKNYLLGIAFPFFGLFTSLLLLFVIIKNVRNRSSRILYLTINFVLIASWGYWVSWSNLSHTQDPSRPGDFPKIFYDIALYILPALFFFISYFSFKNLETIEEKAKVFAQIFYSSFWKGLSERNLVNPENKEEFKLYRLELTKKAVENE